MSSREFALRHEPCMNGTKPAEARPEEEPMRTVNDHLGHHVRRLLGFAAVAIAALCWLLYLLLHRGG